MVKDEELIKEIEERGIILVAKDGFVSVVFDEGKRSVFFQLYEEKKHKICRFYCIDGIKQIELYKSLKSLLNFNDTSCFCFEALTSYEYMGGYFRVDFKYLFIFSEFKKLYVVIK
jgi:hypothetical protein